MQHCDLPTLLHLARCSRWTLACASSAFALKHAILPLSVISDSLEARLSPVAHSKLLSHARIDLTWKSSPWQVDDGKVRCISALASLHTGCLRSLNVMQPGMHASLPLATLLQQNSLLELEQLHIYATTALQTLNPDAICVLPRLQRLHTFALFSRQSTVPCPAELFDALEQLPSLTACMLDATYIHTDDSTRVERIAACAHRKKLRMRYLFSTSDVVALLAVFPPS